MLPCRADDEEHSFGLYSVANGAEGRWTRASLYEDKRAATAEDHSKKLKQKKFIVSQFWRLEVQDQGVGRVSSSEGCEGNLFSASPQLLGVCGSSLTFLGL